MKGVLSSFPVSIIVFGSRLSLSAVLLVVDPYVHTFETAVFVGLRCILRGYTHICVVGDWAVIIGSTPSPTESVTIVPTISKTI